MSLAERYRPIEGMRVRAHTRLAALLVLAALMGITLPSATLACSLDGIASISLNGTLAVRTVDAPRNAADWAPFTFGLSYAPGDPLRFGEDRGKLRGTLPATALSTPFRWDFGDGASQAGFAVAHRYRRTGWYAVKVRYHAPTLRRWLLFDSVRVHIVPAGALLQANVGYRIVQGLSFLTWAIAYVGLALVILVPSLLYLRHPRRRPRVA